MLLQELNQVVAQFLTEDSSWDALVPKVEDTCQRLVRLGEPIPHTVYLDNTIAGESSINAAVPGVVEVKEDHFHFMRRVSGEVPDGVPEKREWPKCTAAAAQLCTLCGPGDALPAYTPTAAAALDFGDLGVSCVPRGEG
jgi:hypothetical protein